MSSKTQMDPTSSPKLPLPSTAQLSAVIEAVENAPPGLRTLAQPIAWLRNRLDPLHELEQAKAEKEQANSKETAGKGWVEVNKIKREEIGGQPQVVPERTRQFRDEKGATRSRISNSRQQGHRVKGRKRDNTFSLMDRTYHSPKLDLRPGQRPHHSPPKPKAFSFNKEPTIEATYQDDNLAAAQGQEEEELDISVPEIMEVPSIMTDEPDPKVRLFPAEEERVAQDLKVALSTNHFKVWPLLTDPRPVKKAEESALYKAPLSQEAQARKAVIMDEWKTKKERDIRERQYPGRGAYDDEMERDILLSTDMFQPTLAPYIGTGKKIPTREEMMDEDSGSGSGSVSGSSGEYVDALEFQASIEVEQSIVRRWKKPEYLKTRPTSFTPPTSKESGDIQSAEGGSKGEDIKEEQRAQRQRDILEKNAQKPRHERLATSKSPEIAHISKENEKTRERETRKKQYTSQKQPTYPRHTRQPTSWRSSDEEEPAFALRK